MIQTRCGVYIGNPSPLFLLMSHRGGTTASRVPPGVSVTNWGIGTLFSHPAIPAAFSLLIVKILSPEIRAPPACEAASAQVARAEPSSPWTPPRRVAILTRFSRSWHHVEAARGSWGGLSPVWGHGAAARPRMSVRHLSLPDYRRTHHSESESSDRCFNNPREHAFRTPKHPRRPS